MQLVGILIGQLLFGFMGDWVGRRTAMLTDMVLILLGVIMLTVANGTSEQVGSHPSGKCPQHASAALQDCRDWIAVRAQSILSLSGWGSSSCMFSFWAAYFRAAWPPFCPSWRSPHVVSLCAGVGGHVRHQPAGFWHRHRRRVRPELTSRQCRA